MQWEMKYQMTSWLLDQVHSVALVAQDVRTSVRSLEGEEKGEVGRESI